MPCSLYAEGIRNKDRKKVAVKASRWQDEEIKKRKGMKNY